MWQGMHGSWGEPWYSWLQQHQSTDCQQEQVVTSNQIAYNSFASVAAHQQPTPSPPPGKEEEKRQAGHWVDIIDLWSIIDHFA